jgi:hypothetical protein
MLRLKCCVGLFQSADPLVQSGNFRLQVWGVWSSLCHRLPLLGVVTTSVSIRRAASCSECLLQAYQTW